MTPVLRVEGALAQALGAAALASISSADLLDFLAKRRWFGAKAEARSARIAHVVALPWESPPAAIAFLDVTLDDRTVQHYQLPLTVRADDEAREKNERAVLARVEAGGARGELFDAVADSSFRERLGAAFAGGETFAADGVTWSVERVGEGAELSATRGKVIGGEQSNTSIVYGDRAILKLFRRLEPGVHPDAEVSRFLTERTAFRNTPALLGMIASDAGGERTIAGMLSALVPNAQDAWAYTLERARAYYGAKGDQPPPNGYAAEARALGATTRALHEALASVPDDPDFAPAVATEDDAHDWAESAREAMERSLALLESRAASLDPMAQAAARALMGRRDALEEHLDDTADEIGEDAGMLIRHHGDYHLGQVLRAGDGRWMIIDFEGEPARSIDERRGRSSPLRDVAGMLRSFAYAAASVAAELRGNSVSAKLELRSSWFERDVRRSFLEGYLSGGAAGAPALLPRDVDDISRVLSLFEIEKTFYELAYELNNRPAWAWIPLRAIAKML